MNFFKKQINKILSYLGYTIVNINYSNPSDANFVLEPKLAKIIKPNTMLNDLRLKNIVEIITYISKNKIGGSIVECGVWKGGSVALMAHSMLANKDIRDLHLFDAFDEICEPDATVDGQRAIDEVGGITNATGQLKPVKGIYNNDNIGGAGNEVAVKNLIQNEIGFPESNTHIHKGWFQEVLPVVENEITNIALLRLDGDWYASTKVCLDYLYHKLVVGGIIIIDDYGAYEGCKKAVDEYCLNNNIFPLIVKVDTECIYWIKK